MPATTISPTDLQRIEQEMYAAMVGGDNKSLENLLSDKLRFIHSNGRAQSKAEVLQDFREPQKKKMDSSEPVTHTYPGVAVTSAVLRLTTNPGSSSETATKLRVAYVWVEEPQGWRLLLRQTAKLPD
jgi:hypothetical protein